MFPCNMYNNFPSLQVQYAFLHEALADVLASGDTSIELSKLQQQSFDVR